MYNNMMKLGPTFRFDTVLTCSPSEATRLLRLLGRALVVATVGLLLIGSLLWSSQHTSQVIAGLVSPEIIATRTEQSSAAERELQMRVDAYLQELSTDSAPAVSP